MNLHLQIINLAEKNPNNDDLNINKVIWDQNMFSPKNFKVKRT